MYELKNVRNRRTDALTHVTWDQLEAMLATYYREQGYRVDHVGTGGTGAAFDGGIDLKLYKDDAYIVVQCKHWNTKQVTHNSVHELLGVMVTQGATGAILVTSGEFSRFAIESATKQGHVQLVDGDDLREMLGPLPDVASPAFGSRDRTTWEAGGIATQGCGRLLVAAEDRIRGSDRKQRERGVIGHAMDAGLGIVLLKLLVGLILVLSMTGALKSVLHPRQQILAGSPVVAPKPGVLLVPQIAPSTAVLKTPYRLDHSTLKASASGKHAYRQPTAAEIRESKRQADEAIRTLERNTPEM